MATKEKAAKATKPLKGKALALAIANDVLLRLKRKNNIIPFQGCGYVSFSNEVRAETHLIADESAQKHLKKLQKGCEVCALGGMFISYIGLKNNNVTVEDLELDNGMRARLGEAFSPEQQHLIEGAFEGWLGEADCVIFYEKFLDDKERLKKIMENIVRNDGKFVPSQDI